MNFVKLKAETERRLRAYSILAGAGSLLEGSAGDQGVQTADDQGGKGV